MTYILLLVVLLIWGIVIYRIIAGTSSADDEDIDNFLPPAPAAEAPQKEAYSLIASYPDPFLKRQVASYNSWNYQQDNKQEAKPHPKPQPKAPIVPKVIEWPAVQYFGVVSSTKGERLAMLNIGGKKNIVKANDKIDAVLVRAIYPDSVQLEFQKQKLTFKKNGK